MGKFVASCGIIFGVVFGVVAGVALIASLAGIFLWGLWTYAGLGATYFYFLPTVWHSPPLFHWIGLSLILRILGSLIFKSDTSSSGD